MRLNRHYLVAAAFASVAIVGTIFFLRDSPSADPTRRAAGEGSVENDRSGKTGGGASSEVASKARGLPKVTSDLPAPSSQEEFIGLLRSILPDTNLHRQRKALLDLMEHLTPEAAPAVREAFLELKKAGFGSDFGWWAFCTRWGEIDPEGAFAYFERRPDDPGVGNVAAHLMEGWVEVDAGAARSWLASNQESPFFKDSLRSYIENLARRDVNQATSDIFGLGLNDDLIWSNMGPLVQTIRERARIEGVANWFDGLTEAQKPAAFEHAMWAFKDANLGTAVTWFTQNADKPWRDDKHFHHIASRYAKEDPVNALAWVVALPDDPGRPGIPPGLSTIMDTWTRNDPTAAAAWLDEHRSEPWLPRAAMGHLRVLMRTDPQGADAFLARLPSETRRAVVGQLDEN